MRRSAPAAAVTAAVTAVAALSAAAAAIGAGAAASPLVAQEAPVLLTFEDAVELALANNPAFQRELNAVTAAEYGERARLGQMLPSLSGNVSFSGTTSRTRTAFDEFGQPLEQETFIESTRSTTNQGLSGSVPLLNLGNLRSYGAARAQTDAREARADHQAAVLRRNVGRAYFDAVRRHQATEVAARSLRTAEEQLDAVQRLLRVLAREPTDVLGAELAVARAEQALNQANGEARKAELQLRLAMGVPLGQEFELASAFPEPFDPAALEVAALLERAFRQSPRLGEQVATAEAAERSLSAARAARYPTLSGDYGWGRGVSAREYEAFRELNPQDQSWRFGLSLAVPLFNRLQTQSDIGRAETEAMNARETLREARLQLEQEVREALINLENAYAGVRLAERSADIARQRLDQGRERYRLGSVDYTALQQMIDDVARDEQGVIDAYFSFADALLTLEEKLGGPVVEGR